jgi:hypothetical protein
VNITEANAWHRVLEWLTSLDVVEVAPDCRTDDAMLTDAVQILTTRSGKALGAGMSPQDACTRLATVLRKDGEA